MKGGGGRCHRLSIKVVGEDRKTDLYSVFRGFHTRMVYLDYIACLRYTFWSGTLDLFACFAKLICCARVSSASSDSVQFGSVHYRVV